MRKLKLKKEIIVSLGNIQKAGGGDTNITIPTWETLDEECITAAGTQETDCACLTLAGCQQPQSVQCPSEPISGGCASQACGVTRTLFIFLCYRRIYSMRVVPSPVISTSDWVIKHPSGEGRGVVGNRKSIKE